MRFPSRSHFLALLLITSLTPGCTSEPPPAVITLDIDSAPRIAAQPLQFGFNLAIMNQIANHDFGYDHPAVRETTARMRPRLIRFPGGSTSNNFLWRDESYKEAVGDITGWVPGHVNDFIASGKRIGLKTFIDYCAEYDITPIYVYNSFEGDGQDLCDFVSRVEELGGKVPYIEFANEPYWDPRSLNNVEPYLAMTRPLASALKAFRPDTQIGICLAPHDNSANYEEIWNAPLMTEPYFDAVVHHEYHGKQGLGLEETQSLNLRAFAYPEDALEHMRVALSHEAPNFPVWLTEYNIGWDHLPQFAYTGAHGMYIASVFAWLNEHGDQFPIANFHQFYQDGFGCWLLDEETREMHYTASFFVWKMLGDISRDATHIRPVPTSTKDLIVTAYESPQGINYLIVNKSGASLDLSLQHPSESLNANWSGEQISYPDLTTKIPYDTNLTETISGAGSAQNLPAYSISIVRRPRSFASSN